MSLRRLHLLLALPLFAPLTAGAISFNLDYGDGVSGVLNTTITAGAAMRMQDRAPDLIGKSDLNPNVCFGQQSCQGVFRDQIAPARTLAAAPGAFSINGDDGDLNYDRYHLTQAVAKVTQDLKLTYGDFGFFSRWLFFYDVVNNNFTQTHPNQVTAANAAQTGFGPADRNYVFLPLRALYFPVNRVYGPGTQVRDKRTDGEALAQIGTHFQLMEFVASGKVNLTDDVPLTIKLGRQTVNWGESTLLVINSINQANPVNANNLFRVGFQLEEVFTPVNMLFLSTELKGVNVEGYYQLEWRPVEAPTPGSFLAYQDVGTNYVGKTASVSFGGVAEDPDSVARPSDNPLSLIAATSTTIQRMPDREPRNLGQYGLALKYFADTVGNGTEFGFYAMNYHSKLPYASFYSANASCARREGNALGIDANSSATLLAACPDFPVVAQLTQGDARAATSSAFALDSVKLQLEYPENIKMFGVSFNTTFGDFSLQGEVAYRPHAPLQVDIEDLAFAALGPTLTRCHEASLNCEGTGLVNGLPTTTGVGLDGTLYTNGSDFIPGAAVTGYKDTINVGVGALGAGVGLGHLPGSARSFPNFIIPYRGGVVGENPPNSYIRGYEYFQTLQYNIGGTYVAGASDNPFGASQIQSVFEIGATHVPDLPKLDVLQIDGPGTYTAASAGADGTGADGSRQACSTNPSCSIGPDGLRFNPTQQKDGFTTRFSWGYRLIEIFKYESVLPGISLQPMVIFWHDVQGTAPGPAENFVEGRKIIQTTLETRYKSDLSFTVGYTWYTGGGNHNLLRDRDFSQAFVKYQF
ncbi:MAG TPA: DUF1302 family protein [Nevskiaceae bacterium]|nr:DUF1302 family protein [Nevskiaceae bacterium]